MQFHFSNHVLDADLRELTRGGESVAVEPQVFDLLLHLIENRDHVVTSRYSRDDGATWVQHPWQMEVSGFHHNVFGGFVVTDRMLQASAPVMLVRPDVAAG